ncbi:MAG: flagellar basal body rod protein FlgB [Gammaproteobacteria bacterium]|nr:flagellar basal body rod protein FlgB [Gammaproteobacteria bacterium]
MKLGATPLIHERALLLRAERSEVLAGNIANADTPGYKARDFDFQKMLKQEAGQVSRMATTNPGHIQSQQGMVSPNELLYRNPMQPSLDGNTVDTQLEHSAFARNAMEYQATLEFMGGHIRRLRTAIKGQ